ncbi:MAG: ubiquinone/menaquinone biosynthesis methyltransferase [Verrucomicrobia bacterium]|jgi:demethylmenaquinone methyltransferase/2-methoxy-6-polyprenyl-1,4-benzoquinol methylase|nr:ubiquinone/menaquinone biosynthesis methyltransferase [Verrucomicrobiota bacterium]|tara:strand:+ start:16965 stop:17639 length:675 start_codon:yes stop_codon:yes gene_type:complete
MPDPIYVRDAFARIADRYVMTNHILSGGMDFWWRHVVTNRIEKLSPKNLLDVASGTGDLALKIQKEIPSCDVIATDFCAEMLEHASSRGVKKTLVADALDLPYPENEFDVLTVAFGLRNMADYELGLKEMRRVLKPGGHLFILDFSLPKGILCAPYRFYLHNILPKMAGFLTKEKDAYEYLGDSIEQFPAGDSMIALLEKNGLSQGAFTPMTFGVVSVYEAVKS